MLPSSLQEQQTLIAPLPTVPPEDSTHTESEATAAEQDTVVEIGPDGEKREWRVGAVEINPTSGEVEREWGMGRV